MYFSSFWCRWPKALDCRVFFEMSFYGFDFIIFRDTLLVSITMTNLHIVQILLQNYMHFKISSSYFHFLISFI